MSRALVLATAALILVAPAACKPKPAQKDPVAAEGGAEQTGPDGPSGGSGPPPAVTPADPDALPAPTGWSYEPQGVFFPAESGNAYADRKVWAPDMCFPLAAAAYANSQVWRPGGMNGGAGGQCSGVNYAYAWTDNFCEKRSRTNAVCAGGKGHQGQDIRPSSCVKDVHWAVAAEDGVIQKIGSYSVVVQPTEVKNGQVVDKPYTYVYLHLEPSSLTVGFGDTVQKGRRIGRVSNAFFSDGKPVPTTIHLHFEIKANGKATAANGQEWVGKTWVSPYGSLVRSYERMKTGQVCALPG